MRVSRLVPWFLALSCVLLWQPLRAQPAPGLQSFLEHIESIGSYSMLVYLKAEGNEWVLQYRCNRPHDIRIEVVDGPMHGTVATYTPADPHRVKVMWGKGGTTSYSATKLASTPIVESVLDTMAAEIRHDQVAQKGTGVVALDVGRALAPSGVAKTDAMPSLDDCSLGHVGSASLEAPLARPVTARRTVRHDCILLEGHVNKIVQQLAIDSVTLDPVQLKIFRDGHLEGVAEVWDMQTQKPSATAGTNP